MMNENLIITLDNNKRYTVVDKIIFNTTTYFYFAEIDSTKEFMIGTVDNNVFTVVEGQPLYGDLLVQFAERASNKKENKDTE